MIPAILYSLCTVTAFLCAWLLLKAYFRTHYRLLLWGGICFCGLTLNNALMVVDNVVFGPAVDLFTFRLVVALISILVLLYGMIWDAE
jgi:uncharacterized membrane protein (DUF106 family)